MQARNVRSNATGRAESNSPGFRGVLLGNKPFNSLFAVYYVMYLLWKNFCKNSAILRYNIVLQEILRGFNFFSIMLLHAYIRKPAGLAPAGWHFIDICQSRRGWASEEITWVTILLLSSS